MRVTDFLRSVELFEDIPVEQLLELAPRIQDRILQPGDVLFSEGDVCEAIYVVAGGFLDLSLAAPSGFPRVIGTVRDGATLGEAEMMTDLPHSVTVTAGTTSRVLCVDRRVLSWLVGENPGLLRRLVASVGRQSMATSSQLLNDERVGLLNGTGRIHVVYGPRGGSGRTTVALNMAAVMARTYPGRVALLDLSAPFSHALLAAGLDSFTTLADVPPQWLDCLDISMISNALSAHPSGFAVLPAANGAEQSEAVNGSYVKAALRVLRRHYDAVIVDCATTLNDATVAAISEADDVLVVAEPRVHAVADLSRVKLTLEDSVQFPSDRVSYLLNHRAPSSQVSREQVEESLGISLIAELPHGGREAYEAYEQGEVLAVKSPRSALAHAIEQLVTRIQPRAVKQPIKFEQRRSGDLFKRLRRAS